MSEAGPGVAAAQEVFAVALEREGFVVELARLPGQVQRLQVQGSACAGSPVALITAA